MQRLHIFNFDFQIHPAAKGLHQFPRDPRTLVPGLMLHNHDLRAIAVEICKRLFGPVIKLFETKHFRIELKALRKVRNEQLGHQLRHVAHVLAAHAFSLSIFAS